ncbi:MAG: hypothetical protein PHF86_04680 [Candidatus Nanoarchaeia archaeon]|jgi:hypothetical protein|nr:hypothetical protein [Candidatus Nanoarchaeia archaeon]
MQLIQYFSDGTLSFNWDQLPSKIKERTDIRDKIFNELQEKVKVEHNVTSRVIFDLNVYAIQRIKNATGFNVWENI